MLQEIPGRVFTPEYLAKEEKKTRRMEYHTERIVTVKFHPTVILTVVVAGIFFALTAYLSN